MAFYMGFELFMAEPKTLDDGHEGYAIKYLDGAESWTSKELFDAVALPVGDDGTLDISALKGLSVPDLADYCSAAADKILSSSTKQERVDGNTGRFDSVVVRTPNNDIIEGYPQDKDTSAMSHTRSQLKEKLAFALGLAIHGAGRTTA